MPKRHGRSTRTSSGSRWPSLSATTACPAPARPSRIATSSSRWATRDELDQIKKRVEDAGVDVLGVVDHGWFDSIYFFDPNGIRLEVVHPTASQADLAGMKDRAHTLLQTVREARV